MKCPHCGSDNPPAMKFCGMCGTALAVPTPPPPVSAPEVSPPRPIAPEPAPAHSGGAFRLTHDHEPSRNLDYLLDDDDEPEETGFNPLWIALLVVALAVGGLGYWHYRNGGWGNLRHNATADAPAVTGSNPGDNSVAPAPEPSVSVTAPAPAAATPPPTKDDAVLTQVHPQNPAATASVDAAPPQPAPTTPAPPVEKPAPKPHTVVHSEVPPKAVDPVTQGENYLYGRGGVSQDCNRGLKMVKPAADQSNAKAMITMGALYATGHCVSRDLPTAYRFFALALRKDPENGPLRQNAEMVWSQMTQLERQQAIRLTQ